MSATTRCGAINRIWATSFWCYMLRYMYSAQCAISSYIYLEYYFQLHGWMAHNVHNIVGISWPGCIGHMLGVWFRKIFHFGPFTSPVLYRIGLDFFHSTESAISILSSIYPQTRNGVCPRAGINHRAVWGMWMSATIRCGALTEYGQHLFGVICCDIYSAQCAISSWNYMTMVQRQCICTHFASMSNDVLLCASIYHC